VNPGLQTQSKLPVVEFPLHLAREAQGKEIHGSVHRVHVTEVTFLYSTLIILLPLLQSSRIEFDKIQSHSTVKFMIIIIFI